MPRVGLELRLGDADRLEVEDIEELAFEDLLEDVERRGRRIGERHAHVEDGRDPLGMQPPHLPDHHGAPVVPDEGRLLVAEVVEQAAQIGREVVRAVPIDLGGAAAPPVAPQVGRDGAVPGPSERVQLMPPRVPELGEAVAEDDRRPIGGPGGDHMELDPVRGDLLMTEFGCRGVRHWRIWSLSPLGASEWRT